MRHIVAIYKYAKHEERRVPSGRFYISFYYIYSWKSGVNKYFIIHHLTWDSLSDKLSPLSWCFASETHEMLDQERILVIWLKVLNFIHDKKVQRSWTAFPRVMKLFSEWGLELRFQLSQFYAVPVSHKSLTKNPVISLPKKLAAFQKPFLEGIGYTILALQFSVTKVSSYKGRRSWPLSLPWEAPLLLPLTTPFPKNNMHQLAVCGPCFMRASFFHS